MITSFEDYIDLLDNDDNAVFRRAVEEAVSEDVLFRTITERPELKKWIIHNKLVPDSVIILLAEDQDDNVRSRVARKRKLPFQYLVRLAQDQSEVVRSVVVHHPKITKQLLDILSHDKEPEIAEIARQRLSDQDYRD